MEAVAPLLNLVTLNLQNNSITEIDGELQLAVDNHLPKVPYVNCTPSLTLSPDVAGYIWHETFIL